MEGLEVPPYFGSVKYGKKHVGKAFLPWLDYSGWPGWSEGLRIGGSAWLALDPRPSEKRNYQNDGGTHGMNEIDETKAEKSERGKEEEEDQDEGRDQEQEEEEGVQRG